MITEANINQALLWIVAASIALVIVPVALGAAVMVIVANLHIVGCIALIAAFGIVTYPRQSAKVVTL